MKRSQLNLKPIVLTHTEVDGSDLVECDDLAQDDSKATD